MRKWIVVLSLLYLALSKPAQADDDHSAPLPLPPGFTYITNVIPTAEVELAYWGTNNFVGCRVDGYHANCGIMSVAACRALKQCSDRLESFGYHLYIFDAYRPQQAVDHFVRWASDMEDVKTKEFFIRTWTRPA